MNVWGVLETLGNLDGYVKNVERNATAAIKAGCEVIEHAAIARAPERTGATKAAIRIRKNKSGDGYISYTVGVGKKDFTGDQFYASFVMYGHYVGSRRLGDKRTKVPENNWMDRAYNDAGQAAADAMVNKWLSLNEASIREVKLNW